MTHRLKRSVLTTSPLSCRQHTSPVSAIFNGSLELWQVALGLSLPHTTVVITLITARSLNQYATGVDRTPCLLTREGHSTLDVHPGWRCSRERGTPSGCDTQDVLLVLPTQREGGNSASLRKADGDQTPQRPAASPRPPPPAPVGARMVCSSQSPGRAALAIWFDLVYRQVTAR